MFGFIQNKTEDTQVRQSLTYPDNVQTTHRPWLKRHTNAKELQVLSDVATESNGVTSEDKSGSSLYSSLDHNSTLSLYRSLDDNFRLSLYKSLDHTFELAAHSFRERTKHNAYANSQNNRSNQTGGNCMSH